MKTEFLIPFEIDTSAIEEKIKEDGYEEVVQRLTSNLNKQLESALPKRYGQIDWDMVIWGAMRKIIDAQLDEIIDTTVLLLANKVGNKKRWRDVLKEIKEQEKEEQGNEDH